MASKQTKAIILMVTTEKKQKEIAKEIGVNETTISRWKKQEDFNKAKKDYEREYLSSLSAKALRTLAELLDSNTDYVRLAAAKDVLDRTGYKPTESIEMIRPVEETAESLAQLIEKQKAVQYAGQDG